MTDILDIKYKNQQNISPKRQNFALCKEIVVEELNDGQKFYRSS